MARYTAQIEVDAPPAAVFAYLEDFSNAARWDPGVDRAERLDDGPIGVGSRFALDLLVAGRTQRWVYEVERHVAPGRVTDVAPGRVTDVASGRVTFATRTARAVGIDDVTVAPTATGSRVDWDATFRFTGALGRLVDPLFGLVFQRIAGKAVAGLRRALGALAVEDA